jgi:hypothetical protein
MNFTRDEPVERVAMDRLWWVGLLAALLSLIAVAIIRVLAIGPLGMSADFEPFHWRSLVVSTILGVLGAVVVFGLLGRFTRRPIRWFVIVATVVLILSFSAPLSLLRGVPRPPGTTPGTVWTLNVMHVVVAVICVALLTTLGRIRER